MCPDASARPDPATSDDWTTPAAQVGTNLVTAAAGALLGPPGAAVAAAASPLVTKALHSLGERHRRQSAASAERVLVEAADAAGMAADKLEQRIGDDPGRLLLAGTAIDAGSRTVNADKLRGLGRALAAGLTDDALVDPELLAVAALADMEAPHIKVLRHIAEVPESPGWPPDSARQPSWTRTGLDAALPEVAAAMTPILATLVRHGLIAEVDQTARSMHEWDRAKERAEAHGALSNPRWRPRENLARATSFGRYVLDLVRAAA